MPITLVGGMLGAGKTTLLNRLLADANGLRLVIMVNDVGEIAVDAALIASATDEVIELTNGCVCCSITDGLGEALDAVRESSDPPDHVVIELSGVAEPARVAPWASTPGFRLDAIVVCVDAERIERHVADRWVADTVQAQLRSADLIVMTKTDLVDQWPSLSEFTDAPVLDGATTPPAALLSIERELERRLDDERSARVRWVVSSVRIPHRIDPARFSAALVGLPSSVIRIKGFVSDGDRLWLVQGVGERRSLQLFTAEAPEPARWGIVAIASPDITRSELDDALASVTTTS